MANKAIRMSKQSEEALKTLLVKPMAEAVIQGQPPSLLESKAQQRKRLENQLWGSFLQYQQQLEHAGRLLKRSGFHSPALSEEHLRKMLEEQPSIDTRLSQGSTLQQLLGLSNQEMIDIYDIAGQYYTGEDFAAARDLYLMLINLNGSTGAFWTGLGLAEQQLGHYDAATMIFAIAGERSNGDLTAYLHAANCLRLQNRMEEALQLLQALIEDAADYPEAQPVKAQAEALKRGWLGKR
jgi:tetratricopeptide (TPR) repeat protein